MTKTVSRFVLLISAVVLAVTAMAQQQDNHPPSNNPLAVLLQSKGILSPEEVATINQAPSREEADARLAKLLVDKGLISQQEYTATVAPAAALPATVVPVSAQPSGAHLSNAVLQTQNPPQTGQTPTGTPPTPPERGGIPAVAPLRVLPIDIPKQGGMIPDLHLGSGANIKLYGFYKASAISDTTSSGGPTFGSQDWPLPLLLADTGPTPDPQVHLKARSFRIGMQTEWVPKNSDFTLTGRVEGDFEGDYTDVSNRNISSVRSNQFTLRLAWMRLDHKIGDLPWFAEFGQDWSLLGSSTLPALFETTGLGVGMGGFYERIPQFKTGVQFHSGDLKIQPEFAIVLATAGSSALTTDQHLRFGDRAGAESDQPGEEARVVFQFPLSHNWRGVAPAQLIFSGHHSRVTETIPKGAQLPTSETCTAFPCTIGPFFTSATVPNVGFTTNDTILGASNCGTASCTLESLFPTGTQVGNAQNAYSAEIQLPTPWVTFDAKFYRGNDLRFFFGGQLNDVFSNLHGLFEVGNGVSESGRAILFGCAGGTTTGLPADTINCGGTPVVASKLQPIGGSGGLAEMSFPLSRIFRANPEGLNSGWILHMMWGTDRANYADASHGNHLGRTDLDTVSLTYRLNKWVTFVHEASYIVTFTANNHEAGGVIKPEYLPFAGGLTRQAHNWRNEFGPVFTF
ncbi:MAG TPA: hypothetical protein VGZ91_00780 [Candidatus Sulfotelmatobacter sp.]|jgi:hypothetical protein|nr:hypothetical protein [Candidatus Sulfotelmatobacter sp.]